MVVKYSCKILKKPVAVNHNSIQCDRCDIWVHTNCNKINKQTYKLLQKDISNWYCIICTKTLSFSNLNDEEITSTVGKKIPLTTIRKKHQPEKEQFIKAINNLIENDPTMKLSPHFYPEEIKQHVPTGASLSLFHLNITSLGYHFMNYRTYYLYVIQTLTLLA